MYISAYFNQSSNKILSLDEMTVRLSKAGKAPDDVEFMQDFMAGFSEWQDAGGRFYISEMSVKTHFSALAGAGIPAHTNAHTEALAQGYFPLLQKTMDEAEDHTTRMLAGKLFPKSPAF